MTLSELLLRARRLVRFENLLALGLAGVALTGALAFMTGRLPETHALALMASPAVVAVSLLRPAWMVLFVLAAPPTTLTRVPNLLLALAFVLPLVGLGVRDWSLDVGRRSGMYPIAAIVLVAIVHPTAELGDDGLAFADGLLKLVAYYAILMLLTYNLVKRGDLTIPKLGSALVAGAAVAGVLEFALSSSPGQGSAGPITYGRSIANLVVMAFAVVLVRAIRPGPGTRLRDHRGWNLALATFFVAVAGVTLLRASWIALTVVIVLVLWGTGNSRWLLVAPIAMVLVLSVPSVNERVVPDTESFDIAQYTTGRWWLWTQAAEKADDVEGGTWVGPGWGTWWTFTPDDLLGVSTAFTSEEDQEFVFPHNDALLLTMDLGLLGLALFLAFWAQLLSGIRRLFYVSERVRIEALMLVGGPAMFLVTQMVSNGLVLRGVAERFFVIAGATLGLLARTSRASQAEVESAFPESAELVTH